MKINKKQNRREFLISSGWNGLVSIFGIMGLSIGNKNMVSGRGKKCPENVTCRECYKMGVCEEKAAVKTRKDIKANCYKAKISKGVSHG